MAVWSVPKLGTELLKFLGPIFDSPGTVYELLLVHGLGVVGPEMTMDFGSTKWNRCLVRGLPMDSPLLV